MGAVCRNYLSWNTDVLLVHRHRPLWKIKVSAHTIIQITDIYRRELMRRITCAPGEGRGGGGADIVSPEISKLGAMAIFHKTKHISHSYHIHIVKYGSYGENGNYGEKWELW